MPHQSISYVWQVTGCQHALLPTDNDFAPPSIPSLTLRGFSRWESVEILLGPEEHVPFLQFAVRNWDLKHPDTGASFPPDLPRGVFPVEADVDVDRWHKSCAEKLRKEASKGEDAQLGNDASRHAGEAKVMYSHVRNPYGPGKGQREKSIDPEHGSRDFSYSHVAPRHGNSNSSRTPGRSPDRVHRDNPAVERARRKSFSEYKARGSEPEYESYDTVDTDYNNDRASQNRRHSHPKPQSSESSEEEPEEDPRVRRRQAASSPPPSLARRIVPPSVPVPPAAVSVPSFRPQRAELREDDRTKRRSGSSPLGSLRNKLSDTVSGIFPGNTKLAERPRVDARHASYNDASARSRRSREQIIPPSRLSRSHSDPGTEGDSETETSEEEYRQRQKQRKEVERDRYREKPRQRGSDRSERDDDRDSDRRRDRPSGHRPPPPVQQQRTSSHVDGDRRRPGYPPRVDGRERERPPREDRQKKWDKRTSDDRDLSPTTSSLSQGRRYPEIV